MSEVFPKAGKITPKTPEEIQAQIAAYASEKLEGNGNRGYVFNNIVSLAAGGSEDVKRITAERGEYEVDKVTGRGEITPAGLERTISAKDYSDFLRSVGGSKYDAIKGRAEILGSYKDFAQEVNKLKEELKESSNRKEHSTFLGHGSNASVFFIEKSGKKYAVRVPEHGAKEVSPSAVDHHLAAAFLSKGVPHLEQVVAASYEDGVTVAEIMPGKQMGKLSVEDIQAITDQQLREFVDTLITAHERGIEVDPKPSNFFYDRGAGFGIVDLASAKVFKNSKDQTIDTVVDWATTPIRMADSYGSPSKGKTSPEDYAEELISREAILRVLKSYRAAVQEKLSGKSLEKALESIDSDLKSSEMTIESYKNPEWVAEEIRKDEEWRRQREEAGPGKSTWLFVGDE